MVYQGDDIKERIRGLLMDAGASAVGFAHVEDVSQGQSRFYNDWLNSGRAGELHYMYQHSELRVNPQELLPDAGTVIATAWNYLPSQLRNKEMPFVARYAYGRDYHRALRSLIRPVCHQIERLLECSSRICIDSAPIPERYWAVKSGIGFIGRNGCLIIPKRGSWHFIALILITASLPADDMCATRSCMQCGACVRACPMGALYANGTVDCRRCLSAVSVEGVTQPIDYMGCLPLLGCDVCQEVCPHNCNARSSDWVRPITDILKIDEDLLAGMDDAKFNERFAGTAFKRPGLNLLRRNLGFGK